MTVPTTLPEVYSRGLESGRSDLLLSKKDGRYGPMSSAAFSDLVRRCAGALLARGIGPGDRVAIFSYNRVEWAAADWACQLLGVVDVPLYSTLPGDQAEFILGDSGAKLVFVENAEKAGRLTAGARPMIAFDAAPGAISFADFLKTGESLTHDALRARSKAVKPGDLATLIYTSGTTGTPKGVMLSHGNLTTNVIASQEAFGVRPDDLNLSFLPLSHSFQRIVDYIFFYAGASTAYAENVDAVAKNLLEVRPTIMASVPRFFEKIRQKILDHVATLGSGKRAILAWALAVGAMESVYRRQSLKPPLAVRLRFWWARKLALGAIQAKTGGRIRFFVSGGAALDRDVAEFFFSLGLTLLEGYGLTETSPVISVNRPGFAKTGSVGLPIPGCEVKIAGDGEIVVRGPNVMLGYLGRPEDTAQVIVDGWFLTGDIGELDKDGFLRITDRKKDLLKTSGGKYIAPQPIENQLKLSSFVRNAVVLGDQRKFAIALVVPDPDAIRKAGREAEAEIQKAIDKVNAGLGSWEQIKKFALIERDFTIENGELTPTMKVKRRVVAERYKAEIDKLYSD